MNVQCRLCSSETALISLFNGKCRGNRDNIRKLIHIATGIKFQKNDACKCICFPCTVQIYNFYIFRTRSIENDEKLQALAVESGKEGPNKIHIPDLDDITLPSIEKLKETLAPWLISKQKYCVTSSTENDENMKNNNTNTNSYKENTIKNDNEPEVVENSTQCDSVENFDKETQCHISINEGFTQTNYVPSKSVHIQCNFKIQQQKEIKEVRKESSTQTEAIVTTNANTSVQIQCELLKENDRTPKRGCTLRKSNGLNQSVRSGRKTLKSDQKLLKEEGRRDSSTQTETKYDDSRDQLFESHNRCEQCCDRDSKSNVKLDLVSIKQEVESPQSLSPIKCLSINVDGTKTEALASPANSNTSPSSSNLLTVKNKIQNVRICQQCDKPMYSKNEYKLHRRSHMVCNFCKKRFTSVRKTKIHLENNCEVQKLIKTEPVVPLIRLEYLKDVQKRYPSCLKMLSRQRNLVKDVKRTIRIRSRSISNVDNIYSNCNTCKCYISFLSGISVGVDKSVQTNFLCDKELLKSPLEYFCENLLLKRNNGVDNNFVPTKKFKLSPE